MKKFVFKKDYLLLAVAYYFGVSPEIIAGIYLMMSLTDNKH